MKKKLNSLKSLLLLAIILVATIACDKDFSNIESDINGVKNFETDSWKFPMVSYTNKITPDDATGIQSNNLPSNILGVYKDQNSEFGTTSANVISQVVPTVFNPDFGTNPEIQSVILNIPYFSTLIEKDEDGNSTYELDSIFGDQNAPFKLSIYQSNYLLRDLDPASDFEETQSYYSNQDNLFTTQELQLLYQTDNFIPSAIETHILDSDNEIIERIAPSLRIDLNNPQNNPEFASEQFWKNLILDNQDSPVLSNRNNFTEFFRGLIFKVEQLGSNDGNLIVLNFAANSANVTIDYTNDEVEEDDNTNLTTYKLNFNGIRANTFTTNLTLPTSDQTVGDDNLFLKGGDGSMGSITLFDGTVENENGETVNAYTFFKEKKDKWIINEANLVFYVNQTMLQGDEPERLMLYDLKNNVPVIDYFLDGSTNTTEPLKSKIRHSEPLERDSDDKGVKYKFRITEHVNNLLLRDSTNVKLGLFPSLNVNLSQEAKIEGMEDDTDDTTINVVPVSSILYQKGTILYGSKPGLPEGQRAEFEIYYTEPQN